MGKRRTFAATFKARVAKEALREDRTVQQIAAKYGLHPSQVSEWKGTASEGLAALFERGRKAGQIEREAEIHQLYKKIGQIVVQRDLLICPAGHGLGAYGAASRSGGWWK